MFQGREIGLLVLGLELEEVVDLLLEIFMHFFIYNRGIGQMGWGYWDGFEKEFLLYWGLDFIGLVYGLGGYLGGCGGLWMCGWVMNDKFNIL